MTKMQMTKTYDLEERTFKFAEKVAVFCRRFRGKFIVDEYVKQLIRASSSIGANYIEANEALGKKDFVLRLKISRKEAKESIYWLRLIFSFCESDSKRECMLLMVEVGELRKIFSAIIVKSSFDH